MDYVCPQCNAVKQSEKKSKPKCDECTGNIIMLPGKNGKLKYDYIHFNLFNPTKTIFKEHKNGKAEVQLIKCCNYQNCQLYERGQCAWQGGCCYQRCFYGKYSKEQGFTRRAGKFHQWIKERQEKYEDIPFLQRHTEMIASIGDYVFLPYSHMNMCKEASFVAFVGRGSALVSGLPFIAKEDFNIDIVSKLVEFRPQAIFGGEIRSYREEVVPLFLLHLKKFDPELYEELCEKNEFVRKISQKLTNVGRKAKLRTIIPNVGVLKDIHGGEWVWDGEWMTCTNRNPSFMIVREVEEIRIKPTGDADVKINEECQVNADTVFVD